MKLGVVVSCYRQEGFLARTVAAAERTLAGRDWSGVLEFAAPSDQPLPPHSSRWRVVASYDRGTGQPRRALTPGAGRMAGLAACEGDWVLFLDSDVELDAPWMDAALAAAAREPGLGGLWGRIEEWFVDGATERPGKRDMYGVGDRDRDVDFLANLAFYPRAALIEAGGYDPGLNSDEDFELGLRLRARGLRLRCLGQRAARHWSAPRPSLGELVRRWRTGLFLGQGQVLRLYFGRRGFGEVLRRQGLYLATLWLWLLGVLALLAWPASGDPRAFAAWAALLLAVLVAMSARKRSVRLGTLSVLAWTMHGLGLVAGLALGPGSAPRASREAAC
ncbi:MAG TPA: glycosyltransferase family 2 protein [Candidatus Eisenbacteria bacterium]